MVFADDFNTTIAANGDCSSTALFYYKFLIISEKNKKSVQNMAAPSTTRSSFVWLSKYFIVKHLHSEIIL